MSDLFVVGEENVHRLVLVLGRYGLDGLAEGLAVCGDGHADDEGLGVGILGEVLVDGVLQLLVLGLEGGLLVVAVGLWICESVCDVQWSRCTP